MSCETEILKIITDRWFGITSEKIEIQLFRNDIPIDITGATIDVWYRVSNEVGKVVKKFTIGDGITVQNLVLGEIEIDAFICDLPIGLIVADVKVTFPTEDPQIFRKFGFNVNRTITQ